MFANWWTRRRAVCTSFRALQPYSPTALQPYSPTALQPYSPTALQPYSPTAMMMSHAAPQSTTSAVPAWRVRPRPQGRTVRP
ncbi:hypothetical protein CEP81_08095 [Kocuria rhizophila]|nr:hypothetical protein CEP81_08095 [Kocuria rhizophila]